jgi:uncharacterized membrane protein YtjA (UPF0391 family)
MKNGTIFLLIALSAVSIGMETVAKVMQWHTLNSGYYLGILLFIVAISLGVKRKS